MSDLVGAILTRPSIGVRDAALYMRDHWDIEGDLRPLPSERDRNWAVVVAGVDRYVLKIANSDEDPRRLDFQHRAMDRLALAGVPCQQVVRSVGGAEVIDVGSRGNPALARLLTWLPGRPLATIAPATRSAALLADLGRVMGRTASALRGFDHPAAHRSFQWSAEDGLAVIAAHAPAVPDQDRAALLGRWQRRLEPLATTFSTRRHGVIHNDANDHNVLVSDDGAAVSGVLDLGDAIWSLVVNELAVAAAYAALDTADPLATIAIVRAGFEEALPLTGDERGILLELVALRLATSVALSAHQSGLDPDDPYLTVSESPAWDLLERLDAMDMVR